MTFLKKGNRISDSIFDSVTLLCWLVALFIFEKGLFNDLVVARPLSARWWISAFGILLFAVIAFANMKEIVEDSGSEEK